MDSISDLTQSHLSAGIKWILMMSEPNCWNLTSEEAAALCGIATQTYHDIQQSVERDLPIVMTADTIERLSLLLGIWKGLQYLVPNDRQNLAFAWFNKTNSSALLQNTSIKNYLLQNNTIASFYVVRDYLNSNS